MFNFFKKKEEVSQLDPEVVEEALCAGAVVARPEGRFGDRDAARQSHPLVVVGGPADHVNVGVDVHVGSVRSQAPWSGLKAPSAPFIGAFSIASVEWSLKSSWTLRARPGPGAWTLDRWSAGITLRPDLRSSYRGN